MPSLRGRTVDRRAARRAGVRHPLDHDPATLRARRIVAGLGLRRLAADAGISHGHLSELESGTRNPSPETLRRLAAVLGCQIADLMPPRSA